jgi:hypothetical protein
MNLTGGIKPNTYFILVDNTAEFISPVYSCIYLVIGGVAKNFLPLLLNDLKIKYKMEMN